MVGLEQCDDGTDDSFGCTSDCLGTVPGYSCNHNPGDLSLCDPICGDLY